MAVLNNEFRQCLRGESDLQKKTAGEDLNPGNVDQQI